MGCHAVDLNNNVALDNTTAAARWLLLLLVLLLGVWLVWAWGGQLLAGQAWVGQVALGLRCKQQGSGRCQYRMGCFWSTQCTLRFTPLCLLRTVCCVDEGERGQGDWLLLPCLTSHRT